jgi:hypothetical protein
MERDAATRAVTTRAGLERLLGAIESGREAKPEWIELRGECRLERLPAAALGALLPRLHAAVRRGFRTPEARGLGKQRRLALWRAVASRGFHDFTEEGWTKNWDSPFAEDYDYVGAYLEGGGLGALDPFHVYSAVLGTHDFGVDDFLRSELCRGVSTIVEPMAGCADFAYEGHFRHPTLRYLMFDLDSKARDFVSGRRWLPDTDWRYWLANVLDERVWKRVRSLARGRSLAYIGKQSHHYLTARQLLRLLDLATRHVDLLMLEVQEPSLMKDLEVEEDLSRPEMEAAGFRALLVDDPGTRPNSLSHSLSFSLEVRDRGARRHLFSYSDWTSWQPVTLCALAGILELRVLYFDPEAGEFRPVEEAARAHQTEDINFLVFVRERARVRNPK